MVANGRHRKTKNVQVEQEEGTIVGDIGDDNFKNYITDYYKGLFGPHTQSSFSMDETLRYDIPQVSEEENEELTSPFSEEEVKMAVFDMEQNKARGLDDFLSEFCHFWEIVKPDLMSLFYEFRAWRLSIHSLNSGVITLLPKVANVAQIQQYRPICLLNVSFKIFMNMLNNIILKVADKLIRPS
jgi:hypothetical protein